MNQLNKIKLSEHVFFILVTLKEVIALGIPSFFLNILIGSTAIFIIIRNRFVKKLDNFEYLIIFVALVYLAEAIYSERNLALIINYVIILLLPILLYRMFASADPKIGYIYIIFAVIVGMIQQLIGGEINKDIYIYMQREKHDVELIGHVLKDDFSLFEYRIGSLFVEPITFGLVCAFGFITLTKKLNFIGILLIIGVMLSGAKSAVLVLVLYMIFSYTRLFYNGRLGFIICMAFIIITPYMIGQFAEQINLKQGFINHLVGYKNGLESIMNNPFGSGLGSSGYLLILENQRNGIYSELDPRGLALGNESAIGVMSYMFGFTFWILFILYMIKWGSRRFSYIKKYLLSIVPIFIITESLLSITIIVFLTYFLTSIEKHYAFNR